MKLQKTHSLYTVILLFVSLIFAMAMVMCSERIMAQSGVSELEDAGIGVTKRGCSIDNLSIRANLSIDMNYTIFKKSAVRDYRFKENMILILSCDRRDYKKYFGHWHCNAAVAYPQRVWDSLADNGIEKFREDQIRVKVIVDDLAIVEIGESLILSIGAGRRATVTDTHNDYSGRAEITW